MTGAELIAAERQRQIDVEGWDAEHDAVYVEGSLVHAARAYAAVYNIGDMSGVADMADDFGWPWDKDWWKPSADPVRNLAKAGALIAAEIDRLQRAAPEE